MSERIAYKQIAGPAIDSLDAVHTYVAKSGLRRGLIDLVYLRTSLINGCAYCIDMHTKDLLKQGFSTAKIALVPVWYEAGDLFTAREKAALAWAEIVTFVHETKVPDEAYEAARKEFSEKELVDLTIAISLMNTYNRLAVSFRRVPESAKVSQA
jgi:AhpD family alkylhydroperoxidase